MQLNLFNYEPPKPPKAEKTLFFCNKWTLQEAMAKLLDIKFQDNAKFPKLLSELYAYSILNESKELFAFLENRYNKNLIQDKEVNLIFEVIDKPIDKEPQDGHTG